MTKWVRVSTTQGTKDASDEQVEEVTRVLSEKIIPMAKQIEGFEGVIAVTNRESGKSLTLTFWESEAALKASQEAANQIRKDAAAATDAEIVDVERYEVTIYQPPRG